MDMLLLQAHTPSYTVCDQENLPTFSITLISVSMISDSVPCQTFLEVLSTECGKVR